jgi:hypothetical protein
MNSAGVRSQAQAVCMIVERHERLEAGRSEKKAESDVGSARLLRSPEARLPQLSASAENIAHLIHQALVFKVFGFDFGQLFEQASLLACQRGRSDDSDGDEEVAAPAPA